MKEIMGAILFILGAAGITFGTFGAIMELVHLSVPAPQNDVVSQIMRSEYLQRLIGSLVIFAIGIVFIFLRKLLYKKKESPNKA